MDLKSFRAQYPQYNDLSDQELAAGLHKKYYSDIPFDDFLKRIGPAPTEDTGFFDMAGRAVKRGFKQTGVLLGDVLPAMVGKAVGADEYAAQQMKEAAETQKEIEQKYGARYKELSDVKGLGDVLPFVTETALENLGSLATAIVPGVGGAALGGRLAAQQAVKTLATREATQAGGRYAALKTAQGAAYGGGAGAFLGSYVQNAPEVFQNIFEATKDEATGEGQMELGASLLAGSVSAALDSVLPAYLVRQFTPGMKAGVVEKILEKSGMAPGMARGAAAGVITGFATEAPTEAAQEAISIAAEKFVDEYSDVWNSKDFNRVLESFVRGGVGGGAISGVAGGIKGKFDKRADTTTAYEGKPGASAFDQIDAGEIEEVAPPAGAAPTEPPTGFLDEDFETSALQQVGAGEPIKKTRAAPTPLSPEVKDLRLQILKISTAIRDLQNQGADETMLADWYAERERLQAQERALRRGEEVEEPGILRAGPGLEPPQLGVKRTYKLSPAERAVTEDELSVAGFLPNEIKRIMFNAKPNSASPLAKDVLGRVAAGQIKIGNELRAVTLEDIAGAQTEQERARLQAAYDKGEQKALLPAQQMGLDLTPAEEGVSREFESPIALSEQEFALTAPEGQVAPEVEIPTEEAPPAAPLNLVADQKTDRLYEMLSSLQPVAEAEQGVNNYRSAITNFLDEVKEYISGISPQQRAENLELINDFFNGLGLTSDATLASNLPKDLKGKPAAQQAQILSERTKLPDLTRLTGVNELRAMFQDFMEQQNVAKLGEYPSQVATKSFANDIYVPAQVANILRQLRNKPEKMMTPDEKAFMAYMSKFKYGLAMRSAAYDLANQVPMGNMFSGQGAKSAALFQKFVEENFPAQIFEAFNETINEYQRAGDRAKYAAERIAARQKLRKEYLQQMKQERAEIEAEMKRQKGMEEKRRAAEALAGKESERMEDLRKTMFNAASPRAYFTPMHPAIEQRIADGDVDGALEYIERMPGAKYWQLLAKRLRSLNLGTTTQFDNQERLIRYDLARIAPTVNQLVENIRDVYPDVYDFYIAPALNEVNEIDIPAFTKALKAIKKDAVIGKDTVEGTQVQWVLEKYEDANKSLKAPGFYMIKDDVINLNRAEGGNSYYAFFHELIHAATAAAIRNPDILSPAQREALDRLKELYTHTVANHPSAAAYGFQSLDEFVAEAFSNAEFQQLLRKLPYQNTESSLWSKFVNYIRRLLGGKDTVLFGTLANADILMGATQVRAPGSNQYTGTLMGGAVPKRPKSTTDKTFRTAPLAPSQEISRRFLGFLSNRSKWDDVKSNLGGFLEGINDATRQHYLGAFTLRQLQDLIGGRLGDSAQNFINAVEDMLEDRNAILDKVSKIQKRWGEFQNKNPRGSEELSLIMIDATLAAVDPDIYTGQNADLDKRWNALPEEAKEIYRQVRDFYKERYIEYRDTLIRNVELSMISQNKTPDEINDMRKRLIKAFEEDAIEPYFPLKRFGKYSFYVESGTVNGKKAGPEFYMFDSERQRDAFAKERMAEMARDGDDRNVDGKNTLSEFTNANIQDLRMIDELKKIVDEAGINDETMKYKAGVTRDSLKDIIKDNVQQLYYLTLPNKSIRKMFINRKQVSGASQDMLRAFVDSSFHMAYQQSRFKYARRMFNQLEAAKQLRQSKPPEMLQEKIVDSDYIAELEKRLQYAMNPTDTGTIPSLLSNVSFIWYLTAPASALVNMLGVPAIGFPVLAARFGKVKAAAAIASYSKRFMTAGFKDENGNFSLPSLGMTKLSDHERAAYDIFVSSGLIDITQSHDLAGVAEAPSNMYSGKMNTIMKGFSYMFHHAERFNREVVAMSTYRMAYDAAIKKGDAPDVAFKKAIAQAKDLTYRSMFDYSTLNKPRYLQNAYAKVILQFKQFPQQMTYLLARSGYEWLNNLSPDQVATLRENIQRERARYGQDPLSPEELEAELQNQIKSIKKEGRDRLLGTLGMTFLFAGATGMPLFSAGSAVIEALHAAFSDDDEPPLDFENWFKNWMAQTFGDFWGDSISRGVITQATGMNFADRMSLNDLWFRDARKSQDEVTAFQNMIINLLGPTASLGISAAEATKLFNDGYYYRGAEKIMPAVLKQPMVGFRYATEGVLTLKGDELVSDISAKDALAQSLGFAPEKVAQKQKANIEKKAAEQDILAKRQDLLNAFFMGFDVSDDSLVDRVLDKITEFNGMYPGVAILPDTLMRSLETRYKGRVLAEISGGIPITKNLMAQLDDMGYYGETD